MRKYWTCSALAGAILMSLAVITLAQTAEWKLYSYPDDGFEVTYPSPPDLQKKPLQTSAGEFELRSYTAEAGDTALFVGVCDYGTAVAGKDSDRMLLGAKNSLLSNSASHLQSEKKIALGTNPGLHFEAENSATHLTARMYIVGSTLYETLVVSPINKPFDQTARFLDSFQLVTRIKHTPGN